MYLIFLEECNTICIFLVNTIIYLILIGDIMYCTKNNVPNGQDPHTTINWHIFFPQRKHQSLNPFTTNYRIIKKKKKKKKRILYVSCIWLGWKGEGWRKKWWKWDSLMFGWKEKEKGKWWDGGIFHLGLCHSFSLNTQENTWKNGHEHEILKLPLLSHCFKFQ